MRENHHQGGQVHAGHPAGTCQLKQHLYLLKQTTPPEDWLNSAIIEQVKQQ